MIGSIVVFFYTIYGLRFKKNALLLFQRCYLRVKCRKCLKYDSIAHKSHARKTISQNAFKLLPLIVIYYLNSYV